jgi:hypothetical protein
MGEVKDFQGSQWFLFTKEGINQITIDKETEEFLILKIYDYQFQ